MAALVREGVLDSDPMVADFRNFLWRIWRELGLGTPTPINYDFAQYLQEGTHLTTHRDVGDRKILMAFRGAAKSWITTTYAVWRLKRLRSEIVLVTSATERFASGISTFAWKMISEFDFLADMKPTTDQRRSALAFDVAGAPASKDESFAAVSITGQITGRRASIIIPDDIETPNTSDTESARQELRRRVRELGGAVIKPGGDIYFLGTAQTEQTIYREYAEDNGYELRIFPILYPTPEELPRYGPRLAPSIAQALANNPHLVGTSTEPTRFTELDILQRLSEWGRTEFDRQFKMFMDAGAGRGNPLKMRDLVVVEIDEPNPQTNSRQVLLPSLIDFAPQAISKLDIPVDAMTGDSQLYGPTRVADWVPAEEVICFVDTSGSGTDETTWTVMGGLLGRMFLLHQGASTDGHTDDVLKAIARDCKRWGVTTIEIEANFGGGMFGELLRPHLDAIFHSCAIVELPAGTVQKEKRIVQTLEPALTGHRLIIRAEVLRTDFHVDYEHIEAAKRRYHRLTYQLSRMTTQKGCVKHDDRADGLAGAAKHFIGVLLRQLAMAQQEGKLRAIEVEGEKLIALRKAQGLSTGDLAHQPHALGRPNRSNRRLGRT